MNNLTPKQARFVEEYLIDLNAKDAAIRAGYSEKAAKQKGYALLQMPAVQEAVTDAKKARSARTGVTQDEVIEGLLHEAKLTEEGSSHSARVSAWAHLGKHLGIFTDNLNVKGGGPVTFVMKLDGEE